MKPQLKHNHANIFIRSRSTGRPRDPECMEQSREEPTFDNKNRKKLYRLEIPVFPLFLGAGGIRAAEDRSPSSAVRIGVAVKGTLV